MIRLTGSSNPVIKEVRSLKNRSAREKKGIFFIEGSRFVAEALKESADILYIIMSDTFLAGHGKEELADMIEKSSIRCYEVPESLFGSISDTQTPQGILAVLRLQKKALDEAVLGNGMLVVMDMVKDPGNMGTIIRTADAAGCAGVIVTDGCVDVFNPKVLRSTMGSIFHIPVYHCGNVEEALMKVKESGFLVCASHLEGTVDIFDVDLTGNVALVVGSEAEGISGTAARNADLLVRIPMLGRAESLNVSVAAGIMMFEAVRRKRECS
ncbi:MAG: TrmH family RNA methyltransferase [Bacillota bacterium]